MNVMKLQEVTIRTNKNGLFRLNDLHNASGGKPRHRPSIWLENNKTIDLIKRLSSVCDMPIMSKKGGATAGTYGSKEVLCAYAAWIGGDVANDVIVTLDASAFAICFSKSPDRREFFFGKDIVNKLFSGYEIIAQFPVFDGKYRIDWYIPELRIAIEFDEHHHSKNERKDAARQAEIENALGCRFLRYKDEWSV